MTSTQEQALNEAKELLKLHFDSFVITTRYCDENINDSVGSDWHGAISDIVGLNRVTQLRVEAIAIQG